MNPWNIQKQYESEFHKVKSLDIVLEKGTMLHIPAYWWYSIKYNENSSIAAFYYKTFMNQLAITPETVMSLLQEQNVKRINFDNLKTTFNERTENQEDSEEFKEEEIVKEVKEAVEEEFNDSVIKTNNIPLDVISKIENIKSNVKNT